ncbi:hypothetical protein BDZ91DRAFT_852083 [Kalaharituber pfeilii]|nr:hypothetical protein BDZ91DRAFT_852083 [Kalaharituber pfeilii]
MAEKLQAYYQQGILPTPQQIKDSAAAGRQYTAEEVHDLTAREASITGAPGPVRKGPAATMQSVYDAQQRFADKAEEMVGKREEEVTRPDARELHSYEARAMGGHQPAHGSLSSEAQHIADTRDRHPHF